MFGLLLMLDDKVESLKKFKIIDCHDFLRSLVMTKWRRNGAVGDFSPAMRLGGFANIAC